MVRKIKYSRLFLFLLVVLVFIFIFYKFFTMRITNIYVDGNVFLSDQEVIEAGKLSSYPYSFFSFSRSIKSNLEKNLLIERASVRKKGFTRVYISVVENRPLFFDSVSNKTILKDGSNIDKKYNVPILSNSIDSGVYGNFLSQLSKINKFVLDCISEIEYTPNGVDDKLFLFTMNDGNYIYVNLDRFESVNKYFDMVVNFNKHKGILYLDSGEYFKILEN